MDTQLKQFAEASRYDKPQTRAALRAWVRAFAGMKLPKTGTCPGHCTPLDYLEHVFFEKGDTADTVVWACRGGGKTMIGAVATLLDLLFKPGIQIRILGGSREQSQRMYNYLCTLINHGFEDQLDGKIKNKGFSLLNGSKVEILTQSQTSVRGTRVQKLRCDELELFKDSVWEAAQLTTRSMWLTEPVASARPRDFHPPAPPIRAGDDKPLELVPPVTDPSTIENPDSKIRGAVEVFSTFHRPDGLMSRLVARAVCPPAELPSSLAATAPRKIFAWCVWDVVGKCREEDRKCEGCELSDACQSRARKTNGFLPIEDVFVLYKRSDRITWENEMLCRVPYPKHQVFSAFRRAVHVRAFPGERVEAGQTVVHEGRTFRVESLVAGIDYGWTKFVCLWLAMMRDDAGRRVLWVLDEYVVPERALEGHAAAMLARPMWRSGEVWRPAVYYADVAGRQHDAHSGMTSEGMLRAAGIRVKSRAIPMRESVMAVQTLIEPHESWGRREIVPRFFVDPRCPMLIEALTMYARKDDKPVKDGEHDHLIDALRYAVVGHDGGGGGKVEVVAY